MRRAGVTRPASRRAIVLPRLRTANPKSLLLGTALASTLLVGIALAPTPAAAQNIPVPSDPISPVIVPNAAKSATGLSASINNTAITETNGPDPVQSITLVSDIIVINSGDIDPFIAIEALIENDQITFTNDYLGTAEAVDQANVLDSGIVINNSGNLAADYAGIFAEIANSDVGLYNFADSANINNVVLGVQRIGIEQDNALANNLAINTSGGIVSGAFGIRAEVENNGFEFINDGKIYNYNDGVVTILSQNAQLDQDNALVSRIVVDNGGPAVAGRFGIEAEIDNFDIYLYNGCACGGVENTNRGSVENLSQSISIDQDNTLANTIIVNSRGAATGGVDGLFATIYNDYVSAGNGAFSTNYSGGAVEGAVSQTLLADQGNALLNNIAINNSAAMNAGSHAGIHAEIVNLDAAFSNASFAAYNRFGYAPTPTQSIVQSANFDQDNIVANALSIRNSGNVTAAVAGLYALVGNYAEDYFSEPLVTNAVGGGGNNNIKFADSGLSQTIVLNQDNVVGNAVTVVNSGDIKAGEVGIAGAIVNAFSGIYSVAAFSNYDYSGSSLTQSVDAAQSNTLASGVTIANSGNIDAKIAGIAAEIVVTGPDEEALRLGNNTSAGNDARQTVAGDLAQSVEFDQGNTVASAIAIRNEGKVAGGRVGIVAAIGNNVDFANLAGAENVSAGASGALKQSINIVQANTVASNITVVNRGSVEGGEIGIVAEILNDSITFYNSVCGSCSGGAPTTVTQSNRVESRIEIVNSGSVTGGKIGIDASIPDAVVDPLNDVQGFDPAALTWTQSTTVTSGIRIENTGFIGADSLFAIDTEGARTTIINRSGGVIEGYVDLTDKADLFDNQAGGTFEARKESNFGGGSDLFRNRTGGTVHTADNSAKTETTSFINLERFDNAGLISLQDRQAGDSFEISNTVGARDLAFVASGDSTLAVDAFLGGPGSKADNLIVNGDISGRTEVKVFNTNFGPGVFNSSGIPVVFANGNVKSDAFFLAQPIDTGFFDYDLFFRPTGSGIFELRSFLGAGAFVLPQLTTAAQDLWYAGSSTWFDRTADLRVLLAGGAAPTAYAPTGSKLDDAAPQGPGAVPAVWVRGSGSWLDRDDNETVTAYGRTYQYKLDRELETIDFQVGLDLGTRDVLGAGDILVFGALGGFVHGDLNYENVLRQFDLSGGQVGGYATYLNGGLFVDTLLNVHFLELDANGTLGFPSSLDATTLGLRTDAGYRFGSFTGGPFIEPLATIAVTWADIDGFSLGGNTVSFDDDANVRGRLGLRAGTSYATWTGVVMEPFVIGSVWGNLSGDTNSATLVSTGTVFPLQDQLDDVWGEVSAGVNFFNFVTGTTVFAKVDVAFGDDLSGVGGKAGMRVAW